MKKVIISFIMVTVIFCNIQTTAYSHSVDLDFYPKGLKGGEIPILARIIAVAESYDAMTNRLSNKAMDSREAVKEIKRQAGTKLDPNIVDLFVKTVLSNN